MVNKVYYLCEDDGEEGELTLLCFINNDLAMNWLSLCQKRWPKRKFYITSREVTAHTPSIGDIETI